MTSLTNQYSASSIEESESLERSDLINYSDTTSIVDEDTFERRFTEDISSTTTNSSSVSRSTTPRAKSANVVHVLPSFYMHQSVLNKSVYKTPCSMSKKAPQYEPNDSASEIAKSQANLRSSPQHYVDLNNTADSIYENIDKLRKCNKPLDLQLTLMKRPCYKDLVNNEPESALKEYTSGDYIYGYFTLSNTSDEDITFAQVIVSLEGYSTVANRKTMVKESSTFLKMCDLGSGFTFAALPTGDTGIIYSFDIDKEGCRMGLPHSQVLKPGIVYKKFFEFQTPLQLLDESCTFAQSSHLLLPPSFGYDERYDPPETRVFNEMLGYARTSTKNCPISFKDRCPEEVSINYTVNVRVVGANPIKDKEQFQYALYKQDTRFIRFIPYGFCIPFEYGLSTLKQLELLYQHMESELEDMKKRAQFLLDPGQPIPLNAYTDQELTDRKERQLLLSDNSTVPSFPLSNSTKEIVSKMVSLEITRKTSRFFSGTISSAKQDDVVGILDILSLRPSEGIPYEVPSFVHKINSKSLMDNAGRSNIRALDSSLTTNEKKSLQEIELKLIFRPNNNSVKAPNLATIMADLELNTVYSTDSVPFTIDQDFVTDKQQIVDARNKFNVLVNQFKRLGKDAKIRKDILDQLNSIMNLKLDQESIPYYKVAHREESSWSAEQDRSTGKIKWTKKVKLQLQVNPIRNLTLVPTFQSCYVSRFYNIRVNVLLDNGAKANLNIPVRVRKFDWKN